MSRTDGDYVLACLQISGKGVLTQDHRGASVGAYDIVFFDSSRPFSWSFAAPFEQIVLRFPRASLRHRLPLEANLVAETIAARSGVGRLTVEYLIALANEREHLTDPIVTRQVSESAADLLDPMKRVPRQADA